MKNMQNQDNLWKEAKTLEELGEATAKWIEGSISFHPCYRASIDFETKSLEKILTAYNRNGFITTFSQPAEQLDDSEGFCQRACVEGYAEEEVAKKLATLGLYTNLLVFIYPPDCCGGYRIPITLENFHPFTWCGDSMGYEEFDCFSDECSKEMLEKLKSTWKVVVIDLQWGRNDYLWDYVYQALTKSPDKPFGISPADEDLDTDFVF